jgi:hypothetical protein
MAGGAISQLSVNLVFFGAWIVVCFEVVHAKIWRSGMNTLACMLIGIAFFGLWKITPKPKISATLDQEMAAFANNFPGLKEAKKPAGDPLGIKPAPIPAAVRNPLDTTAQVPCKYSLPFTEKMSIGIGRVRYQQAVTIYPRKIPEKTLMPVRIRADGVISGGSASGVMVGRNTGNPILAGISIESGTLGVTTDNNEIAELWIKDMDKFSKSKAVQLTLYGPKPFNILCVEIPPNPPTGYITGIPNSGSGSN